MTSASPALTCYRHPGRETHILCTRCDRPICPDCMTEASVGFQCPECISEGRSTQRQARTWFGGTAAGQLGYVTITLIALNVLVFLANLVVSRGASFGNGLFGGGTILHQWGAVHGPDVVIAGFPCADNPDAICQVTESAPGIDSGAYYRLVTSMFLQYGAIHLAVNMWALWILGRQLEMVLGPLRFAALYLIGGLGGSVAAYLFAPESLTAGASGAIFGLFAAFILVLRKLGRSLAPIMPIILINVFITFAVPNISVAGHLGGFLTGGLVAAGLVYAPQNKRTPVQVAVAASVIALLLLTTMVSSVIRS
ncbi:MAG: rhomboid family intramembrane serine protease [Longispora sp.]|nr:rhomboid family intramembrane serine protease [Longispora sp. (in: high G+C Gram-positive bacteria)]